MSEHCVNFPYDLLNLPEKPDHRLHYILRTGKEQHPQLY